MAQETGSGGRRVLNYRRMHYAMRVIVALVFLALAAACVYAFVFIAQMQWSPLGLVSAPLSALLLIAGILALRPMPKM